MREKEKILHIEDNFADAYLMQEAMLGDTGSVRYDIEHVDTLKDALNSLQSQGYKAVLLDLELSDASGLSNISAIREEQPDLPIVVLSGQDDDAKALQAIEHGAQEYIVKGHSNGKVINLALQSSICRKEVETRLFKQANFDCLTGLPNQRFFIDSLERELAKAKRWQREMVVMFLDLDNFKPINDEHGHDAGNAVLMEAADRMTKTVRKTDLIARYGGDEFIILLDDHSKNIHSIAGQVATKLLTSFDKPFEYNGNILEFSASIGIAIYSGAGDDYTSLIASADKAMYQAKKSGGHSFYFADLNKK